MGGSCDANAAPWAIAWRWNSITGRQHKSDVVEMNTRSTGRCTGFPAIEDAMMLGVLPYRRWCSSRTSGLVLATSAPSAEHHNEMMTSELHGVVLATRNAAMMSRYPVVPRMPSRRPRESSVELPSDRPKRILRSPLEQVTHHGALRDIRSVIAAEISLLERANVVSKCCRSRQDLCFNGPHDPWVLAHDERDVVCSWCAGGLCRVSSSGALCRRRKGSSPLSRSSNAKNTKRVKPRSMLSLVSANAVLKFGFASRSS